MRLIWLVPKSPVGPPDGARQATAALVGELTALGASVDMVCLSPKGEPLDAGEARRRLGVDSCASVARAGRWLPPPWALRLPCTFWSFAAGKVRRGLRRELGRLLDEGWDREWPFVVFDGLHTFAALSARDLGWLAAHSRGFVYRAHNFETTLWTQCASAARAPWRKAFFSLQAALVRAFERRASALSDLVAPVSREDAARFTALFPGARVAVVPIGAVFPEESEVVPVRDAGTFELLFVGKLDWLPNRAGLAWFLDEVWPELARRRPEARLSVAGTGDSAWLEAYRQSPGVSLLGRVPDLQPLYESSALTLAPIFQGSGTRVKIIESARFARPALTTALGAEGTGLTPGAESFQAETREDWLDALSALSAADCRAVGLAAFRAARRAFDARAAAESFRDALLRRS